MPINQFDTSIAMGVKPPQVMSLGDMLNIARGAQEYQQRQKLNPVELETAESEKERSLLGQKLARETLAPKIEQQKFQTESAGTQLNTQKLENTRKHFENVVQNISTLITKPDLTRDDIINRATEINKNAGGNEQSLAQTLAGLPESNNVNDLRAFLAQGLTKSIGGLSQLDKLAPGGVYPSQLPQLDNAPRGTNENMPTTPTNTQGVTKEDMNRPAYSQPVKIPYPVRTPTTVTPFAPTEKADQEAGFNFRNNLVNGQSKLATSKRNLEEVMDSATKIQKEFFFNPANILGRGERLIRYGINAEDLQKLRKDLANVVLANEQAMGGSTDAGRELSKTASGDETYSPKVLLGIANRAFSDVTNIQMKATAAQKFAQKYGDNNMKAFQQMWSNNEDSKIFELYNIFNNEKLNDKEKAKAKETLFPKNEKQRKAFIEKYNNIKKLTETGEL
jgi:hypothetical protein